MTIYMKEDKSVIPCLISSCKQSECTPKECSGLLAFLCSYNDKIIAPFVLLPQYIQLRMGEMKNFKPLASGIYNAGGYFLEESTCKCIRRIWTKKIKRLTHS